MRFADPWWLLALAPLLGTAAYFALSKGARRRPRILHPLVPALLGLPKGPRVRLRHAPLVLRLSCLALLVLALARPQGALSLEKVHAEGIDIVLVLDASGSMQFDDFQPNRLAAAKEAAAEFVTSRPADRIGLVTFATTAVLRSPLTLDHAALRGILERVEFADESQTAIGVALAAAVNRLRGSDSKGKAVVLLTDGANNAGDIDPLTAAQVAAAMGVKVYTIGAGARPEEMPLMRRMFGAIPQPVDEGQLTRIAQATGGRFFRATDGSALGLIYAEIGRLETRPIEGGARREYREDFALLAGLAALLVLLEFLLRHSFLQGVAV